MGKAFDPEAIKIELQKVEEKPDLSDEDLKVTWDYLKKNKSFSQPHRREKEITTIEILFFVSGIGIFILKLMDLLMRLVGHK
jgi:hypothetical protein